MEDIGIHIPMLGLYVPRPSPDCSPRQMLDFGALLGFVWILAQDESEVTSQSMIIKACQDYKQMYDA